MQLYPYSTNDSRDPTGKISANQTTQRITDGAKIVSHTGKKQINEELRFNSL